MPTFNGQVYFSKLLQKNIQKLGFKSYQEYLDSDSWRGFKEEYKFSGLPEYCLGCNSNQYVLHHISYKNLGNENYGDVIPLCRDCHFRVHSLLKKKGKYISDTIWALSKIFRWKKPTIDTKTAPFVKYWEENKKNNIKSRVDRYIDKVMSTPRLVNDFYKLSKDSINVSRLIKDGYSPKQVAQIYKVSELYVLGYIKKFPELF